MAAAVAELPVAQTIPEGFAVFDGGRSVVTRSLSDIPEFEIMRFPRRTWLETNYELRYHVYASPKERTSIPAHSALEAIAKSGIRRPFKVVRGKDVNVSDRATVVGDGRLVEAPDIPDASESETKTLAETADFDPDIGSVSLTREEINALLHPDDDEDSEGDGEGSAL
ncbi:MAG: hypothetical protein QGF53_11345 [Alphaproteobacteria bacterium]|jgi:hypothetical protein|nr:hypothetical protein [Alphaproteobacteria bacterium]